MKNPGLRSETWGTRICGWLREKGQATATANTEVLRFAQNDEVLAFSLGCVFLLLRSGV